MEKVADCQRLGASIWRLGGVKITLAPAIQLYINKSATGTQCIFKMSSGSPHAIVHRAMTRFVGTLTQKKDFSGCTTRLFHMVIPARNIKPG